MTYTRTTWSDSPSATSPLNAANLNNIESALVTLWGVAPITNGAMTWDGTQFRADAGIKNANVDAAAAIAYSKLSLTGSVTNSDIASGAAIVGSKLATGMTGPPGTELSYVEFTSAVSVTATTEATANTVVTAAALTFDGATPALVEFFSPDVAPDNAAAGRRIIFALYDGSSSIGFLGTGPYSQVVGNPADVPVRVARRLTPAAATKTYSVRAFVSAGTATVSAGAGGAGVALPGYIRITKV